MENFNLQPKSDQEINLMLYEEWIGILTRLWTAFGKDPFANELTKAQLKVYKDALEDMPMGILEHVVEETIRRHKYNSVPTLGEVQDVIDDLHPYYQGEDYVHTRPNRAERLRQRRQSGQPEHQIGAPV